MCIQIRIDFQMLYLIDSKKIPYHDVLGLAEEAQDLGYKLCFMGGWLQATKQ